MEAELEVLSQGLDERTPAPIDCIGVALFALQLCFVLHLCFCEEANDIGRCRTCSFTIQGAKQHGHVISRSDYVPESRKSITLVTSTWSSGHAGPLGICVPDNFLRQEQIDSFNEEWKGEALIFKSQSSRHFMCAETFIVLLHQLLTPAVALQRHKLGVDHTARALLLADAWSGFHAQKDGMETARMAWSEQCNCGLPALQVGFTELKFDAQVVFNMH